MLVRKESGPRPSSSASPGRRLWRKTSAWSARRRRTARPRSSRNDNASERLPALTERNIAPSPFQNGGPQARASSPVSGRSTLTTSPPRAARTCAQWGPAIDVVTSRTRVPASGRCATWPSWPPKTKCRRLSALAEAFPHVAGGRLCRPGGPVRCAMASAEEGGSWGKHGFPHVLRRCADVRSVQGLGLGRVVELPRHLRRVDDRRLLPAGPERDGRDHRRQSSRASGDLVPPPRDRERRRGRDRRRQHLVLHRALGRRAHRAPAVPLREGAPGLRLGRTATRAARLLHHRRRALHPRRADRHHVRVRAIHRACRGDGSSSRTSRGAIWGTLRGAARLRRRQAVRGGAVEGAVARLRDRLGVVVLVEVVRRASREAAGRRAGAEPA